MRILITGASGFIGSHLTQAMLDQGHEVLACVRQPERAGKRQGRISHIRANFATDHSLQDWTLRLDNVDVVINSVGVIRESGDQTFDALHARAPAALFRACQLAGVRRVIQISSLGADADACSAYHKSKHAADNVLRASSLDWAILTPSIVYGPGAKSMAMFRAIAALPATPLIDDGEQRIQPLYIDDLVRAVVELVETQQPLRTEIKMVGPEPITMKDLYAALRNWLGLGEAALIRVPHQLAMLGARFLGPLGQAPITAEAIGMLLKGNTGDVEPFVKRFGFRPRSIATVLAATPAQQADRWHAGLYFLAPLLRLSIAFLWLYTGLASAFLFPVEKSHELLAMVGVADVWRPFMLYGAAATDFLLGLATLFSFHLRLTVLLQTGIIAAYTIIITLWLPEFWLHPFGPISKNMPLLAATLVMLVMEGRR